MNSGPRSKNKVKTKKAMKNEDSQWLQENFVEKFLESSLVIL